MQELLKYVMREYVEINKRRAILDVRYTVQDNGDYYFIITYRYKYGSHKMGQTLAKFDKKENQLYISSKKGVSEKNLKTDIKSKNKFYGEINV